MNKAIISKTANIGKNVSIGENVIIKDRVKIGKNCTLQNNIILYEDTVIGQNVLIQDGAVVGKLPVKSKLIKIKSPTNLKPLVIGKNTTIGTYAVIFAGTTIGNNCLIGDGVNIREKSRIGHNTLISRGVIVNNNTSIGNNCRVMDQSYLTGGMIIEDDVFISLHVVSTNDNAMARGSNFVPVPPIVKKGALIGAGVCLLPGVEIGEYSVVGTGAVVTKNVPPRKLAWGVPAKVVKDTPAKFLPKKLL